MQEEVGSITHIHHPFTTPEHQELLLHTQLGLARSVHGEPKPSYSLLDTIVHTAFVPCIHS